MSESMLMFLLIEAFVLESERFMVYFFVEAIEVTIGMGVIELMNCFFA